MMKITMLGTAAIGYPLAICASEMSAEYERWVFRYENTDILIIEDKIN